MCISTEQWRKFIGCNTIPSLLCLGSALNCNFLNHHLPWLVFLLLVTCGNVHPHPGPTNSNFSSEKERGLFIDIRTLDNKIVAHQSHVQFYACCLEEQVIPKGLNFKVGFTATIPESQQVMKDFVDQSKIGLLATLKQSYEAQIPPLVEENQFLLSTLSENNTQERFRKLKGD
jgi:hypothetical protein